jgi:hypothetical protein
VVVGAHVEVAERVLADRREPDDAPVLLGHPHLVIDGDDLGDEVPVLLVGVQVRQERQERLERRGERRRDLVRVLRPGPSDHPRTLRSCPAIRTSP